MRFAFQILFFYKKSLLRVRQIRMSVKLSLGERQESHTTVRMKRR